MTTEMQSIANRTADEIVDVLCEGMASDYEPFTDWQYEKIKQCIEGALRAGAERIMHQVECWAE